MENLSFPMAGVMGWPISHSLSPILHGFWLKTYALNGKYEALAVSPDDLAHALRDLSTKGLKGVNLTIPHKIAACDVVDQLDSFAKRVGAINLVVVDSKGKLQGHNTDVYGFTQNLLAGGFQHKEKAAFILGAGGAARAVIVALLDMGFSKIYITNRTQTHGELLASEFSSDACSIIVKPWVYEGYDLSDVELVINTTSLGMTGQPPLKFGLQTLPSSSTVTDIVYAPLETNLLKEAKAAGHPTIDGLGMLLHQARPAFKAFFGRDPEVTNELRKHVLAGRN